MLPRKILCLRFARRPHFALVVAACSLLALEHRPSMLAAAESAGNKACPVNYPVRAQQYVLQSIVRVVPAANAGGAGATAVPLPGKRTVLFSWNALRVPASVPTEQRAATLGVSLPGGNSPMGTQTMLSTDTSNQPAYSPPSGLPVSNQAPGKYAPPDGVPTITPPPAPFVRIPPPTPAALPPPPAPAAAPPLASGNNPAQIAQKARQVAAHQAGRVTSADGSGVDDPNGMGVATGGGATGGPSLNQAVIVWVPGRNSGFPRQFPAKITWVDREHNLAVATLDAAVLPADVAAPPLNTPQARVPLFAAQFEAAAKLDAKQEPTDVPPLDIVCDNDGAQALGAPLFDSYGHWVGFAAGAQTEQSTGEKLRRWLAGTVKNVTVDPAGFDPGVGGRITLHVEIASLLGPPERLELIVGSGRYARPAEMHFDRKTERYVASLTVPPAPGAADRPVDESKLPAPTKLNYRMNPDCMVAKSNHATATRLYVGEFTNQYLEIADAATRQRRRIYFSALVHADFAADGSVTALTTDNRTLKGHLESNFTYLIPRSAMKWTCGVEQITYIEIPGAQAADTKVELPIKITGVAGDGKPFPEFDSVLK